MKRGTEPEHREGEQPNLHVQRFLTGEVSASDIELEITEEGGYRLRDRSYSGNDSGPLVITLRHEELGPTGSHEVKSQGFTLFAVPLRGGVRIHTQGDDPSGTLSVSTGRRGEVQVEANSGQSRILEFGDPQAVDFKDDMGLREPGYLYLLPQFGSEILSGPQRPLISPQHPSDLHYSPEGIPHEVTSSQEQVVLYANAARTPTRLKRVPPKQL